MTPEQRPNIYVHRSEIKHFGWNKHTTYSYQYTKKAIYHTHQKKSGGMNDSCSIQTTLTSEATV